MLPTTTVNSTMYHTSFIITHCEAIVDEIEYILHPLAVTFLNHSGNPILVQQGMQAPCRWKLLLSTLAYVIEKPIIGDAKETTQTLYYSVSLR